MTTKDNWSCSVCGREYESERWFKTHVDFIHGAFSDRMEASCP